MFSKAILSTTWATVAVMIMQLQLSCTEARAVNEELKRDRRGIGKIDIETTALDYMIQLRARVADSEGKPMKNLSDVTTSVWCFLDKAVVDGVYRPKPTGEGGRCGAIGRYYFDWEAVANTTGLALNKSIIRPYMQVINRLISKGKIIPVNISVALRLFNRNMTANDSSSKPSRKPIVHHFVQTINVTTESDGWLELDITHAILTMWTPTEVQPPIIEITLRMEVDCVNHRKVPMQFVSPAEVELTKEFRREKFTKLQPLLVINLDDQKIKDRIMGIPGNDSTDKSTEINFPEVPKNNSHDLSEVPRNNSRPRPNRQADFPICRVEDFVIDFSELKLGYIDSPRVLNIKRCAGPCSHYELKANRELGTNHAEIMASANYLFIHRSFLSENSTMYLNEYKDPCCSPIEYEARMVTLVWHNRFVVKNQLFPDFVVTKCACR